MTGNINQDVSQCFLFNIQWNEWTLSGTQTTDLDLEIKNDRQLKENKSQVLQNWVSTAIDDKQVVVLITRHTQVTNQSD